jgi:hypothetical protein
MARYGVSITKSTSFRGFAQEFSNVYYYEGTSGLNDDTIASSLISTLVAHEKTIHSTAVTFVRARVWTQTGDKATSNMIRQENLSGTGARATTTGFDKERAWLFRMRAGVDSRGQPVYLRKWYHSCGFFQAGVTPVSGYLDNTTQISAGDKTALETEAQKVEQIVLGGQNYNLCAKSGRQASAGEHFKSHNYLEHHQLGDMWRAQ